MAKNKNNAKANNKANRYNAEAANELGIGNAANQANQNNQNNQNNKANKQAGAENL